MFIFLGPYIHSLQGAGLHLADTWPEPDRGRHYQPRLRGRLQLGRTSDQGQLYGDGARCHA